MMYSAVICLFMSGCIATDYVTSYGRVYECQATAVDVLELCTDLDQEDLEGGTGWSCWPTRRLWPALFGCIYSCEPGHVGCNATTGCFCPEAP